MKVALIILGVLLIGSLLLEIGLRLWVGLGDPPLYMADSLMGYRLLPNQKVRRFGNRIEINQYSMRNGPVTPEPVTAGLRVLLLGDSVANGGWWTDQPHILSAQIERHLQEMLFEPERPVEVLNASANSWGPRNELAYLVRFGLFEAQIVVLLLNTDDLFAIAPNSVQVGRDRSYPERKPLSATVELLQRSLIKPQPIPELQQLQDEPGDRVGVNLEAIRQIQQRVQGAGSQLIVAMTPLLREVQPPGPRDYEQKARQRVKAFMQLEQIAYVDFLADFQTAQTAAALYRDHIHLSPSGNESVSQAIASAIQSQLKDPNALKPKSIPEAIDDDLW
ncbi:MAG: SGNH/GDSL hydrolase family protein [Leptolyngbyaceae cyanobacterium SM1_1_3]|nr:SGNH/GDSL hydrolase family protein [Leptolyngbyaceae cyanobacterium SM1_1_3]NJN02793.1 SGNH/GDSL hydrolase family protein [Leptolyngbyaceae cyanobacterium RM1_1_2]